jgi:ATP-dependent DNA helicase RecG
LCAPNRRQENGRSEGKARHHGKDKGWFQDRRKDLEIRGQGEILGTRQSGIQNFKIANIIRDLEILDTARKEAEHYLTEKRLTKETAAMVEYISRDRRMQLAQIG